MVKRIAAFLLLIAFVAALIFFMFVYMPYWFRNESYRTDYADLVERYSSEYGIDKNFVFSVIRTESNFDPNAVSDAGAIGLMQMIEDSFDWVSDKLGDDELEFNDLFIPENSIKYGCYMLGYLYNKYESYELVAAAYHSGMGEVDSWLSVGAISRESPDVSKFSGSNTRHYVSKVMSAYDKYIELDERK